MSTLPPLPRGAVYTPALGTVGAAMYTYTANQLREYAAQAVAAERERCARIAETVHPHWLHIAAAIRGGD